MRRDDDRLDALIREARWEAPPGLAERLARAALDRSGEAKVFRLDLERTARRALAAAAAAALVAVSLAAAMVNAERGAPAATGQAGLAGLDEMAALAISPAAFERRMAEDMAAPPPARLAEPGEAR
jgi:hypothetical protein